MMRQALALLGRYVRQPDKALHVLAGLPAGLLWPWLGLWALWLGALLAWGKEWHDKARPERHTYDGWDAFATLLGALLGASIAEAWRRWAPQILDWIVSGAV